MANLREFKVKDTGEIVTYPAHFADHPVFGLNIEPYDGECEVDKVVVEGHELPVEQRTALVVRADESATDTKINKEKVKN